ncbi:hypothetical protein JL101_035565 (plasmid) [Skermanella rosea]|uniref:hypothetical protein n=1 Tax=Skermanella rosea TaxID=1817965 RepID=UPI001931B09A|nr:hypothetical protein [Skermanella rosea]UEM08117.1 hypothetical protein JL101_035565 [Skermanella rosea]
MTEDDDIDLTFAMHLHGCGYLDARPIGNGTYACIYPLLFTHAIIVGQIGDYYGFEDRWCYHGYDAAKAALDSWNGVGEPQGWHRHPRTGRRRPQGDAALEHVNR